MKEFSTTFKEGLVKGLRSDERNPRNSEALVECYNLKPTEVGLIAYEPIANPLTGVSADWPFPQLFLGQDVRVLATATALYELSTWTLGTAKATVTETNRWDFIDFGSYLILTNGLKLCIRDYAGTWSTNDYTSTIPRFATGCNFNGQIVAGNVKSTWHGCGTGSLIWSRIGSVDCTPGGDNEAGFRNTPWEGDVLRVKKLGKGIVVYCENGIGVLSPYQQTFGWDSLIEVGIPAMSAIGGNENIHVFVDTDGNLWRIKKDFSIQKLGYREYMNLMTAADIVVEHNPVLREFHISDDSYGFILTEKGLGKCYQEVTTVAVDNGTSYGVFHDQSDAQARIITDTLDFGLRGLKTLQTVEVGGYHSSGTVSAYAQWRVDKTAALTTSPTVLVNPDGVSTLVVTADEFRVGLTYTSYSGVEVDYMNFKLKLSDKRYVRGKYDVA
uniref:Uncharacterized protein n=1 Tax=viral metagenome TaxID=1070528 RepID=A0A6M3JB42_9ZZZZ